MLLLVIKTVWIGLALFADLTFVEGNGLRDVRVHACLHHEVRRFVEGIERGFAVNRAAFHGVLVLRDRQFVSVGKHLQFGAGQNKLGSTFAQRVGIETAPLPFGVGTDEAKILLAIAERDRN